MGTVLRIIGLLLTWGPIILGAIQKIEVLIGANPGEVKKEAALNLVKDAFRVRGLEFSEANAVIVSTMIDFLVSVLNAWNLWKGEKSK